MPWLTTDNVSTENIIIRLYLPDDDTLRAAFVGAFLSLCEVYNWEQYGLTSPEWCAGRFWECYGLTFPPDSEGERDMLPVGSVFFAAGEISSTEIRECDGAVMSAALFPALYGVIGTTYGDNGPGTFKLPDVHRRFVRSYAPDAPQIQVGAIGTVDISTGNAGWLAMVPYIVVK